MVAKKPFDPQLFLSVVGTGKTVSKYRKGEVIFAQGEVADSIYYLQTGRVKVVVLSEQGKEAVVGLIEPGQFFGEDCMNGHRFRIATTTTMESCLITAIQKSAMLAVIEKEPKISALFMQHLLTRNSRVEEDLIDQLFNSQRETSRAAPSLARKFWKRGSPHAD